MRLDPRAWPEDAFLGQQHDFQYNLTHSHRGHSEGFRKESGIGILLEVWCFGFCHLSLASPFISGLGEFQSWMSRGSR